MPYTIKIDRTLCSGYGDCVGLAPDVFAHDEENISVVVDPEGAEDELILEAAVNGQAEAIVTHNARDFHPAFRMFGIPVKSQSSCC